MNLFKIRIPISAYFFQLLLLIFFIAGCGATEQPAPTPTTVLPTVEAILAPKITEIPATVVVDAVAQSTEDSPPIESAEEVEQPTESVVTVGDLLATIGAEPETTEDEETEDEETEDEETEDEETEDEETESETTGDETGIPEPSTAESAAATEQELAPTSTAAPTPDLSTATALPATPTRAPLAATVIPTTVAPTTVPTVAPVAASDPAALPNPPNELGAVLVLEYHLIEPGEDGTYTRTPESVLADLEWLYANDFYPIKFRDLAEGTIDIPAGKSPVVLAFDDSSIGQFRFLDDGTVDPTSAMGVILDFAASRADFPPVITAFPLLDVDVPSRILWGQPGLANRKLQMIVEWGGEIGSHTVSHERLDLVGEERIQWQLAYSTKWLEERIGNGYEVRSLALPLGAYPRNEALLRSGESEGNTYAFSGAAEVAGGPAFSPFSTGHDPYHIRRAQAVPGYIDNIFSFLANRPSLKYTSDGDPQTITIPSEATLDEEQRDTFVESAWSGYRVVRYDRE